MADGWGRGFLLSGVAAASMVVAMEQPPAAAQPQQLPEIVVNAPSPIVRPRPARPRPAAPRPGGGDRPGARSAARPHGAAARLAPDRRRPVRHRHRGHPRGNPAHGRRDARRLAVRQARHHRLELRARRVEPPDHPRPRQLPGPHPGERHQFERRIGFRRRSRRATRSAGGGTGRGGAWPGDIALGLAGDRRRRQRHQQPDPRCAALPAAGADAQLWNAREGDRAGRHGWTMLEIRDARRLQQRRQRPRWRCHPRCRRGQFRLPRRRVRPPRRRLPHPALSLSAAARPDASVQWAAAELVAPSRRTVGRRLLRLRGRICRRRGVALRKLLSHTGTGIDGDQHPHRHEPDQGHEPRRIPPAAERYRGDPVLARAHRLQARRAGERRRLRRRAADLHQQGAGRPRRSPAHAVRPAFRDADDGGWRAGHAPAADGAGCRGRAVRSQPHHQRRGVHVQRVPAQRDVAGAGLGPYRTGGGARRGARSLRRSAGQHRARSPLHAQERRRWFAQGPAVGPRRQHHRAICGTRAACARIALTWHSRGHRDLRHRQPEPEDRGREDHRGRHPAAARAIPFRGDRLLHALFQLHLPQSDRLHL